MPASSRVNSFVPDVDQTPAVGSRKAQSSPLRLRIMNPESLRATVGGSWPKHEKPSTQFSKGHLPPPPPPESAPRIGARALETDGV